MNPIITLFALSLALTLDYVSCCFGIGPSLDKPGSGTIHSSAIASKPFIKKTKPLRKVKMTGPSNDVIVSKLLGDTVKWTDFSNTKIGHALDCNFEEEGCCWFNQVFPGDQLQWVLAQGMPDQKKFYRNFGPFDAAKDVSPPFPNGHYLLVGTEDAAEADEAHFISCFIDCAASPITVSARHWSTPLALLQVCIQENAPDFNNTETPLLECQDLPVGASPGPSMAIFHPSKDINVVFVASNLISIEGEMVIIDDIKVSYDKCSTMFDNTISSTWADDIKDNQDKTIDVNGMEDDYFGPNGPDYDFMFHEDSSESKEISESSESPESPVPVNVVHVASSPGSDHELCLKINCRFEHENKCKYDNFVVADSTLHFHRAFDIVKGHFHNRVTGVVKTPDGYSYLASYLYPGEHSAIEVRAHLPDETHFQFLHYEATSGVQMKACCDSHDLCPFITSRDVDARDRVWKQSTFKCPPATEKILFICENTYFNQGACAIDDIQVINQDGQLLCS